MGKRTEKNAAVFLDRDGTIIREKNYLRRAGDLRLLKNAPEALRMLAGAGFKLILVTNQSGIGRGYFTERTLRKIHRRLEQLLASRGTRFDAIYYCPHVPGDGCRCRKPSLGMVERAAERFNLDLRRSYAVGDHAGDFLLGQKMGGKGVFVLTGHGRREHEKMMNGGALKRPDFVARDVRSAARWILRDGRRGSATAQRQ